MDETIEIIKELIKRRVNNKLFDGDINLYEVNSLPDIMVWGSPEGTIFSIFRTDFSLSKLGKNENQIIEHLEVFASDGFPKTPILPDNINAYIKFRLKREFPMIAHLYTDSIILNYKNIIYEKMGYNQNSNIQQHDTNNNKVYSNTPIKSKEGCYIATACYGSYDTPELLVFRNYRDNVLSKSLLGRLFIRCYYLISPFLVKVFLNKYGINRATRKLLDVIYILLKVK